MKKSVLRFWLQNLLLTTLFLTIGVCCFCTIGTFEIKKQWGKLKKWLARSHRRMTFVFTGAFDTVSLDGVYKDACRSLWRIYE